MISITDIKLNPDLVSVVVYADKFGRAFSLSDLTDKNIERFKEDVEEAVALVRAMRDKHLESNILTGNFTGRKPLGLEAGDAV